MEYGNRDRPLGRNTGMFSKNAEMI